MSCANWYMTCPHCKSSDGKILYNYDRNEEDEDIIRYYCPHCNTYDSIKLDLQKEGLDSFVDRQLNRLCLPMKHNIVLLLEGKDLPSGAKVEEKFVLQNEDIYVKLRVNVERARNTNEAFGL